MASQPGALVSYSNECHLNRRSFLNTSFALAGGLYTVGREMLMPEVAQASDSNLNLLGPQPEYSPQVGGFVSMITWMREANGVISATEGLTTADLDYLIDPKANTIGALMLHLAATETYYQLNTFDGKKWDSWPDSVKQQWDPAKSGGCGPKNDQRPRSGSLPEYPSGDSRENTRRVQEAR